MRIQTVRKFICRSVSRVGDVVEATLSAVSNLDAEPVGRDLVEGEASPNRTYTDKTSAGTLTLTTTVTREFDDEFVVGKVYYLKLVPAV